MYLNQGKLGTYMSANVIAANIAACRASDCTVGHTESPAPNHRFVMRYAQGADTARKMTSDKAVIRNFLAAF